MQAERTHSAIAANRFGKVLLRMCVAYCVLRQLAYHGVSMDYDETRPSRWKCGRYRARPLHLSA